MPNTASHAGPEIIVWLEDLEEDENRPLTEEEVLQASYYFHLLVAPRSIRKRCRCGLKKPRLELLSDDPIESEKATQQHLDAGIASRCLVCSVLHLRISEVHAHHSAFLHSRLIRDSQGAIRAARNRCAIAAGL